MISTSYLAIAFRIGILRGLTLYFLYHLVDGEIFLFT